MVKNILLACVLTAAGGYLLGSILFGVLISKVMYNDDVRNHGSGNAGMTNVLRTYGKLPAVFTTLGDVGKSVAAVNLGRFIFDAHFDERAVISLFAAEIQRLCILNAHHQLLFRLAGQQGNARADSLFDGKLCIALELLCCFYFNERHFVFSFFLTLCSTLRGT